MFWMDPMFDHVIEQLKKEDNISARLNELLVHDLTNLSQQDIYSLIKEKAIFFPFNVTYSKSYSIDRFPVYRVRTDVDLEQENIDLTRTFSYPNPSFCKNNGRANISYKPVFYCTDFPGTALAEVKPKNGKTVYLTEWLIRCHRPTSNVYIFPQVLPKQNSFITIANNRYNEMIDFFDKYYGKHISNKVTDIMKFFANVYREENAPYSISSCLSNHYLYSGNHVDYIVYPSVQTQESTCNIAFHPNFVDEFLKLDKIYELELVEVGEIGSVVNVKRIGEYYSPTIIWRNPKDEDLRFMPIVTQDMKPS